jgi:hypothetical protein
VMALLHDERDRDGDEDGDVRWDVVAEGVGASLLDYYLLPACSVVQYGHRRILLD